MNHIQRTNYKVNETIAEKSVEQSIHMDIHLPEYCGDISRVLHCFAFANISSSSLSQEKIQIEGNVLVRVLYMSEGELFSYEQSAPFSTVIEHGCDDIGAVADVSTYVQYVNCRAASSRKFEVSGAFAVVAKLSACREASVVAGIEQEDIQTEMDLLSACSASGNAAATVSVAQVVDIGSDKVPMKSIIRTTAVPVLIETKQVSGKMLVKGELKLKTLYKSENNVVEYIENSLPLSQILDIEGMDETSTTDIKLTLISLDVTMKPSALGNMSLLDIQASVYMQACAYDCIDFPVLKDAYSTEYDCECSFKEVSVDRIVTTLEKNYLHNFTVGQLGDVNTVVDVWCEPRKLKADLENGQLVFSGTLSVYILYEDGTGTLSLKESESEYRVSESIGDVCKIKCQPSVSITGCDYRIQETGLEVRADMRVRAVVFECMSQRVIDDITLSETTLKKSSSLFIYYAVKGEKLWDIARKYKTTVSKIMAENDVSQESIPENKALLIWG